METAVKTRLYTPEEYLELERKSEEKSEYHDGEIITMAGGSINHNRIAGNIHSFLNLLSTGKDYEAFTSDLRLWISRYNRYVYPDVTVISGEPIFYQYQQDIITNPVIIFEVLSPSTKNFDRSDKFQFYRSIPELQEYIMIHQDQYYVEQFTKTVEGKWTLTEYESVETILILSSINTAIPLTDIYKRVHF
jgi:Uma2 family endonuclease